MRKLVHRVYQWRVREYRMFFSVSTVVVLSTVLLFFYVFREPLSWIVWEQFRLESIATAFNRADARLVFDIGNYYFGGAQYDITKAEKFITKAIALNSNIPSTHYQLARIHFLKGNFQDALIEINTELRLSPHFYKSYYMRGLIYGYSDNPDKAIADFKTFLSFSPESWAGHNDLAWVYFKKGEYKNVVATAREGLRYTPDNPWLLNALGVALLNQGDWEGARTALKAALAGTNIMTPTDWGESYPGNNPAIYSDGLAAMKASIERNLELIKAGSG